MEYIIVEADSAARLQERIQNNLCQGWEPLGGLAVATYAMGNWWYYQAMVKRPGVQAGGHNAPAE